MENWQTASAGFHLATMTTTVGLDHEARSRPLGNKPQILRIACTDRPFPGLEYRQTSSLVTHRAMPDKI
jgi:hypothetical protein